MGACGLLAGCLVGMNLRRRERNLLRRSELESQETALAALVPTLEVAWQNPRIWRPTSWPALQGLAWRGPAIWSILGGAIVLLANRWGGGSWDESLLLAVSGPGVSVAAWIAMLNAVSVMTVNRQVSRLLTLVGLVLIVWVVLMLWVVWSAVAMFSFQVGFALLISTAISVGMIAATGVSRSRKMMTAFRRDRALRAVRSEAAQLTLQEGTLMASPVANERPRSADVIVIRIGPLVVERSRSRLLRSG